MSGILDGLRRSLHFSVMLVLLCLLWAMPVHADSYAAKQLIYDDAGLLSDGEEAELTALSVKLGAERETEFIILALEGADGKDIVQYVEDFYDDAAPGFDRPHGNTAILAIDMKARDVYLAGFKKAETYLDDGRLDKIRNRITPDLTAGNYYQAFSDFITIGHDYMGYRPGVNPDNLLFKWWFQIAAALIVAGIVVALMAYRSGGRVTVNSRTYLDAGRSKVLSQSDTFVNQTVTRVKKPTNNSSGGGGGGGITGGGHSHSGSRGKF